MMNEFTEVPAGFELVRTTPTLDNVSVPAALRGSHHVAPGAWGRLIVRSGELVFVFGDSADTPIRVGAGGHVAIPPERPHHLELDGPTTFAVEFFRPTST
jgi:hemoglobin